MTATDTTTTTAKPDAPAVTPAHAKPSLATTRDAIAHERHGCLYADLPDDGPEQDAIASEVKRRLAGKEGA